MIKVALVDDHPTITEGLENAIAKEEDICVTAIVHDGKFLRSAIKKEEPNIIVLDYELNNLNGIDIAKEISKTYPKIKIIMFSMHNNAQYFMELSSSGISGYLTKSRPTSEVVTAIKIIHNGGTYYSQDVIAAFQNYQKQINKQKDYSITPKEKQIIELVKQGLKYTEIAGKLGVSINTVEFHRKNIYSKLNISSLSQLLNFIHNNNIDNL